MTKSVFSRPRATRTSLFGVAFGALIAGASFLAGFASDVPPAEALGVKKIVFLQDTVDIRSTTAFPDLLFIVRKSGVINVLSKEKLVAAPFLDISKLVLNSGERGLLSMAFAPDYKTSGLFYVFFVNKSGDIEIGEFKRKSANSLTADPASHRVVMTTRHREASNHNGGQLHFGPDGYLYASIGDGGHTANAGMPAVDINNRLGKILRIIPTKQPKGAPYGIPKDNPFVGKPGDDSVFAYGFRNPWRFSFSGINLIIGDVGEGEREEINYRTLPDSKGANFGWPKWEGTKLYKASAPEPTRMKPPILQMYHSNPSSPCAVAGGFVVRDPKLTSLVNRYIYSDYCNGIIRSLVANVATQKVTSDSATGLVYPYITGFGEGARNQVYFSSEDWTYRITP